MFACFTFIFVRFRRGHEQALRKEGRGGGECASRHRYRKRNNNASCHFVFHRLRLRPFAPLLSLSLSIESTIPTCQEKPAWNLAGQIFALPRPLHWPTAECRTSIRPDRSAHSFRAIMLHNLATVYTRSSLIYPEQQVASVAIVKVLEGKILEISILFVVCASRIVNWSSLGRVNGYCVWWGRRLERRSGKIGEFFFSFLLSLSGYI